MCGVKQITVRILSIHFPAENSLGIIYIHSYIENCADIISLKRILLYCMKQRPCGYFFSFYILREKTVWCYFFTLKKWNVCILSLHSKTLQVQRIYYLRPAIHTEQVTVGSPTSQKQTCVEIRATHFTKYVHTNTEVYEGLNSLRRLV
jgi:hypothetical protein